MILYYMMILQWMQGNIYRDVFPTFLTKKSYGWWITRRRMEIYTKISEKISQSVGRKYREALRTISQVKTRSARFRRHPKRAAKLLRSKRLVPHRCEVGFHLVVFGFHRSVKLQGKSKALCKKAAKSFRNKRVISQHFAESFLQLGAVIFQRL